MIEKTVIIIADGRQLTLDGNVKPEEIVGYNLIREIEEVVDDTLVHCYSCVPIQEGTIGEIEN